MFALIAYDQLRFKVDDGNRQAYEDAGLPYFTYTEKGKPRGQADPDRGGFWQRDHLPQRRRGQQWPNVVVFDEGFSGAPGDHRRWLYTAITRAERGPVDLRLADHLRAHVRPNPGPASVPGREAKRTMFPLDHCILPVAIEFRMTRGVRRSATVTGVVWAKAVHRVAAEGVTPEQAVDEAIARIKQILAQ